MEISLRQPHGCSHTLWAAKQWRAKARAARLAYYAWRESQWVLRETRFWTEAVEQVQRAFPGSASWVLSCSDAEGWNRSQDDRWVLYAGRPYYLGAEHTGVVGGPGQFRWPTFKGMFRRGLEYLRASGYHVPDHLRDPGDVRAWRSMLGQAIAMGAAYSLGLRGSHWSASYGNGC